MAQLTAATLQAVLDTVTGHDAGTMSPMRILQEVHDSATYSRWYIVGDSSLVSATDSIYGERAMWVKTTDALSAAVQAAEVRDALRLASNIDPDAEV